MEHNLTRIALFAAMVAALGVVPPVTLGFGVPISAQSMGAMLAGAILGARRGAAAMGLFVLLVALGLPLLSGGRGGVGVFVSPTGGFALGFVPAALITGWLVEHLPLRPAGLRAALAAVIGGIGVLYLCGAAGLSLVANRPFPEALKLVLVFVPGDLLKAGITGMLVQSLAHTRPQMLAWLDSGRGRFRA